jgi:uncharacterized RDD family membrane protein YckC
MTTPDPTQVPPAPLAPADAPPPPLLHAPPAPGVPHGAGQPPIATVGNRFVAYLLDVVLATVTLGIGWLIWAAITAGEGQTPGKKITKITVWDQATNRPMSWGKMVFLRGVLFHGIIAPWAYFFTLGVLAFMPLWDSKNQTIVDKMSSSIVVQTG